MVYKINGGSSETVQVSTSGYTISDIASGSSLSITASADGYNTYTQTYTISFNRNISITLSAEGTDDPGTGDTTMYTFTINPTQANATVTLSATGYSQSGNSITVPSGTSVAWRVSANGYTSQSGTHTVTKTESKSITLNEVSGGDTGYKLLNMYDRTQTPTLYKTLATDGSMSTDLSYAVTDYIGCKENTVYSRNAEHAFGGTRYSSVICFYNSSKTLISGSTVTTQTFTTPSDAAYMKISIYVHQVNSFTLTEGELPSKYYGCYIDYNTSDPYKLITTSTNLLNSLSELCSPSGSDAASNGFYFSSAGATKMNSYKVSHAISVTNGDNVILTGVSGEDGSWYAPGGMICGLFNQYDEFVSSLNFVKATAPDGILAMCTVKNSDVTHTRISINTASTNAFYPRNVFIKGTTNPLTSFESAVYTKEYIN